MVRMQNVDGQRRRPVAGWAGFAAWGLAGALLTLTLLGALTIGIFVAPFAALATYIVGRRVRLMPEAIGVLDGMAALLLFVAWINRDLRPCPSRGSGLAAAVGSQHVTASSCGGPSPLLWLAAGLLLATTGFVTYAVGQRRS